ncbi:hypothetical protein [Streptomyces sp. NPDC048611]|uniref:hypothetical protein n=1 Tax=Streptomyces sp. NPDC048611 TaxID=3155635 RepID=UPI0034493D99
MTMNEDAPAAEPATAIRPKWWGRPLAAGVAGLAIGAGAVGSAWAIQASQGSQTHTAAAFTLRGKMTLTGDHIPSGDTGEQCTGYKGYDDISEGAAVTVYDTSGKLIAKGALGAGKSDDVSGVCEFDATVPDVPKGEKFYQVEVSHRGKISATAEEAEEGEFAASLG